MPAYEITLISHILIFLLHKKGQVYFEAQSYSVHAYVLSAPRLAGCVNVPEG